MKTVKKKGTQTTRVHQRNPFTQKRKARVLCTHNKTHKKGGYSYVMMQLFGVPKKHRLPQSDEIHCICAAQVLKKKKIFIIVTRDADKKYTMHARLMPTSMLLGIIQLIPSLFKRLVCKILKKKSGGSKSKAQAVGASVAVPAGVTGTAVVLDEVDADDKTTTEPIDTGEKTTTETKDASDLIQNYYNKELKSSQNDNYEYSWTFKDNKTTIHRETIPNASDKDKIKQSDEGEPQTGFSASETRFQPSSIQEKYQEKYLLNKLNKNNHDIYEAKFDDGHTIYYTYGTDENDSQFTIIASKPKYSLDTAGRLGSNISYSELCEGGLPVEAYSDLEPSPSATTLLQAGYKPEQLYTAHKHYNQNSENGSWFSPEDLKEAGVGLQEMHDIGIPAHELTTDSWTVSGPDGTQTVKIDDHNAIVNKDGESLSTTQQSWEVNETTGTPEYTYEINEADGSNGTYDVGNGDKYTYDSTNNTIVFKEKEYYPDDGSNTTFTIDGKTIEVVSDNKLKITEVLGDKHQDTPLFEADELVSVYGKEDVTSINEVVQRDSPLYNDEDLLRAGIDTYVKDAGVQDAGVQDAGFQDAGVQDTENNQLLMTKILAAIGLSSVFSQVLVVFFAICGVIFLLNNENKKTDSSRYFTFYRKILKKLETQQNIDAFREKFQKKINQTMFVFEKKLAFCPTRDSLEKHLRECVDDPMVHMIGYSQNKSLTS